MIAWEQMHQHHINGNENNVHAMMNELNNWANNMNDNDILRGRQIVQLLASMNMTVNTIRNTYENQMNLMRQQMEERIQDLNHEIRYLRDEVTRLNNVVFQVEQQDHDDQWVAHAPPVPVPPPPPQYTKEELCAELLESIEDTKAQMQDQTYRTLTEKLMEIYNR